MGYARVAVCHIRRRLRVAGIDIAEIIAPYLRAYPLAVGVLVFCGRGRRKALDEVAECRSLGGAVGILRLPVEPDIRHIFRGKVPAVFFYKLLIKHRVVRIVIRRGALGNIGIHILAEPAPDAPEQLIGQLAAPDISVHRIVSRLTQENAELRISHALDGLSEEAAAYPAVPRACYFIAQAGFVDAAFFWDCSPAQFYLIELARLVKFIVLFERSAGHYIKHDIRYALFILAAGKMRNSLEKLLIFIDIYALFTRLPELNHQLLGIQLPRMERRIVGSDARPAFFVADALGAAGQQFIERNIEYLREYYQIVHRRLRVVTLPLLHRLA